MKRQAWALGLLLLATSGCATSDEALEPPASCEPAADRRVPQGQDPCLDLAEAPFPLFGDPVELARNPGGLGREASLALDPSGEGRMAACVVSGESGIEGGQSQFFVTKDGGETWSAQPIRSGPVPGRTLGIGGYDCDVAYDAGGTLYAADLWEHSVTLSVSLDGGASWSSEPLAGPLASVDRPWLAGGGEGVVHLTYHTRQRQHPSVLYYSRSDDHGATLGPPVVVAMATAAEPYAWSGNLVALPGDQRLFSTYTTRMDSSSSTDQPQTLWLASSGDGGATWSTRQVLRWDHIIGRLYASLATDGANGLHIAFSSPTGTGTQPAYLLSSADAGQTWSEPRPLFGEAFTTGASVAAAGAGTVVVAAVASDDLESVADGAPTDWRIAWAVVGQDGSALAASTTDGPLSRGTPDTLNEYNQVRVDASGRIHLAASLPDGTGDGSGWKAFYQGQRR